jgi:HEAT repeats
MEDISVLFTPLGIFILCCSLIISLTASALLLRAAAWLICGKEAPNFGSSMAISFVSSLVWCGIMWGTTLLVIPMLALDASASLVARGMAVIIAVLVVSGVYSSMIPTSYLKGVAIFFMQGAVLFAMCCVPSFFAAGYLGWRSPGGAVGAPAANSVVSTSGGNEIEDHRPALDEEFASDSLRDLGELRPQASSAPPSGRPELRRSQGGISSVPAPPAPSASSNSPSAKSNEGAAPAPAPAGPARPPLLVELESGSVTRIRAATAQIEKTAPDENQKEINGHLVRLIDSTDAVTRQSAARALVAWANADVAGELIKGLESSDRAVRLEMMSALANVKGERAILALIGMLKKERDKAREALIQLGSDAEGPVRAELKSRDMWIREDACKILEKIGSSESYRALDNATRDPQNVVRRAAVDALRALRGEKPGDKKAKG